MVDDEGVETGAGPGPAPTLSEHIIYKSYMWQDWVNGVLGLAVMGVAFLGLSAATLGWTIGILGAIITVVGFWGAGSYSESATRHSHA